MRCLALWSSCRFARYGSTGYALPEQVSDQSPDLRHRNLRHWSMSLHPLSSATFTQVYICSCSPCCTPSIRNSQPRDLNMDPNTRHDIETLAQDASKALHCDRRAYLRDDHDMCRMGKIQELRRSLGHGPWWDLRPSRDARGSMF